MVIITIEESGSPSTRPKRYSPPSPVALKKVTRLSPLASKTSRPGPVAPKSSIC